MTTYTRLDGETAKAYEAFCVYRELETGKRSLERVSEMLHKSVTVLARWSTANNWVERAAVYDDYLKEQDRIEFEKQRKIAKRNRLAMLSKFEAHIVDALKKMTIADPKIPEVTQALRLLLEQERIEFDDLPTAKSQNLNVDMSTLTMEQLDRIAKGEDVTKVIATPDSSDGVD